LGRLEGWATTLLQRAHVLPIGLQLGYSLLPSWPFKKILEISREFILVQTPEIARASQGRVLERIRGYWRKLLRQLDSALAKVGVVGSNPIARSKNHLFSITCARGTQALRPHPRLSSPCRHRIGFREHQSAAVTPSQGRKASPMSWMPIGQAKPHAVVLVGIAIPACLLFVGAVILRSRKRSLSSRPDNGRADAFCPRSINRQIKQTSLR